MSIVYATSKNAASKSNPTSFNPVVTPWTRPGDWLTLPSVSTSDQKLVGLYAVYDTDSNYIALSATTSAGTYTVDWGDGSSPTTYASGATAQTNILYSSLSSGTLSTRGYRQAIVTVTATTGNLTGIDLNMRYNNSPIALQKYNTGWLDVTVGSPNLTSLSVGPGTGGSVNSYMLERFTLASQGSITQLDGLFAECRGLQKFVVDPTWQFDGFNQTFYGCSSLSEAPFMDTSIATNMPGMFINCTSLQTIPPYDTGNVNNMSSMFQNCYNLVTIPQLNTQSVGDMSTMFQNCYNLTTIPLLNTINVSNMNNMFTSCVSLITIPLLNTSNVTSMSQMFTSCDNLTTIPLLDTINLTNMTQMFSSCNSLESIPLLNTSNVNLMSSTFSSCFNLPTIPLLNTTNVTTMQGTFTSCLTLSSLPMLDTSNVTNMQGMFSSCLCLPTIPTLDTINVTNMSSMLSGCTNLTIVPLINTSNVANMQSMFNFSTSLSTVPLFDTSKVTTVNSTFNSCTSLKSIPAYNLANVNILATNFANGTFSLSKVDVTGLRYAVSYASAQLSKTELEKIFTNLGSAVGAQSITITGNPGADTAVTSTLTAGQAVGVTTLTVASSASFVIGMSVTNAVAFSIAAITMQDTGDTVSRTSHGLANGTRMSFTSITTTTGISVYTVYYVVNRTANTFQVSLTLGGAALPLTNNGSGFIRYEVFVTGKPSGTQVTVSAPTTTITTATALSGRLLNTYLSTLKNFSITG